MYGINNSHTCNLSCTVGQQGISNPYNWSKPTFMYIYRLVPRPLHHVRSLALRSAVFDCLQCVETERGGMGGTMSMSTYIDCLQCAETEREGMGGTLSMSTYVDCLQCAETEGGGMGGTLSMSTYIDCLQCAETERGGMGGTLSMST